MQNVIKLEHITKGFANRRRVAILQLLARNPDLDVDLISTRLNVGYTSIAAHLQKMHVAGIISKQTDGYFVLHRLTPRGKQIYAFLNRLH